NLDVSYDTLTLSTNVFVDGLLNSNPESITPPRINGAGNTLTVADLYVTKLTLDHAPLRWFTTSAITPTLSGVTFQNYAPGDVQFYVRHPGLATPISLGNGLTFTSAPDPSQGGYYVKAEDDLADLNQLELSFFLIMSTNLPAETVSYPTCLTDPTLRS